MQPITFIKPELMVAQRLPTNDGYTWTLASRLGDMLRIAQELFGERDSSYTILGIEFVGDNPRIWYPGNRRDIVVQLSPSAAVDMSQACYQLAHETVHLLAPSGCNKAINFEEGLACYFAGYYMRSQFGQPHWRPSLPSYIRALGLIAPRMVADVRCIRRLRSTQPSFSQIARDDIVAEFSSLSSADVDFLVSRFDRNAG